jgi:hypothetical protein
MTLQINRASHSLQDYVCSKICQNPLKDVDSRVFTRMEGRTFGSVTISLRNFVGEGIIKQIEQTRPFTNKIELMWSGRIRSASSNHDCTFNTQSSNHDCTFNTQSSNHDCTFNTRTVVTVLISYFNFHSFQNIMK